MKFNAPFPKSGIPSMMGDAMGAGANAGGINEATQA